MREKGIEKHFLLQIWIGATGFAIFVLVVLYLLMKARDERLLSERLKEIRMVGSPRNQKKSLDAVFLGSSMTKHAFNDYNSLDSCLIRNKFKLNYQVVGIETYCLRDFNSMIKTIKTLRPRNLVIESNIACINLNVFFTPTNSINLVWFEISEFRRRLGRVPEYFLNAGNGTFDFVNNFAPKNLLRDEKPLHLDDYTIGKKLTIRKIDEFPLWTKFFKEAQELGIKVILLEIPRSQEAENQLSVQFKQEYNDLVMQFHNFYKIDYVGFPDKIPQKDYYLDRGHMNETGADYYCDWLLKEFCLRKLIDCK